jgi:hypothetical protein
MLDEKKIQSFTQSEVAKWKIPAHHQPVINLNFGDLISSLGF